MLSKSTAMKFLFFVTILTFVFFVALCIDTIGRMPIQTNEHNIDAAVKRGKKIWEDSNCMGCHTIFGEGAYYAPELSKVYNTKSEGFLKLFLKNPEAMYPGKRRMKQFNFSDNQIEDIIAFLKWISEVDLNGFPPAPIIQINQQSKSISVVEKNRPEIINQLCLNCHILHGKGGTIGPDLSNIGSIRNADFLKKWIKDPASIKTDSLMPKLPLSDNTIIEIVEYLIELK